MGGGYDERGLGIKEKTNQIIVVINDPDILSEEREKARKNRDKFIGVGIGSDAGGMGGGYDNFSSDNKRLDSYAKRYDSPQEKRSLASRLDRDPNSEKLSTLRAKANDDQRSRRRDSDRKISSPIKRKESSSSSNSDSDSKKKTKGNKAIVGNLLDMNEPAFGGFDSFESATSAFDSFEFGGFTSAKPVASTSSFDSFSQQAAFGDFMSAPKPTPQSPQSSFSHPQQSMQSSHSSIFTQSMPSHLQQMQQQQMQQQQIQQQQIQQQQQQQMQQRLLQQQQQARNLEQQQIQQQPGFLNDISAHLYDLSLSPKHVTQQPGAAIWNQQQMYQQPSQQAHVNQQHMQMSFQRTQPSAQMGMVRQPVAVGSNPFVQSTGPQGMHPMGHGMQSMMRQENISQPDANPF